MHEMGLQEPKNYIFAFNFWEAVQNAKYSSIFILEKNKYCNFNENGLNKFKSNFKR